MKKLIILLSVVLFCLSGMAKDLGANWVVTGEGKIDCKKITLGYNNARIVFENGKRAAIPLSSISSYTLNDKVFTKLPLYKDGKPTNRTAFMELIKNHGELSLYKFSMCNFVSSNPEDKIYCYFLYKGDKLHLALDEKTLPNICKHFGLTCVYE